MAGTSSHTYLHSGTVRSRPPLRKNASRLATPPTSHPVLPLEERRVLATGPELGREGLSVCGFVGSKGGERGIDAKQGAARERWSLLMYWQLTDVSDTH